MYCSPSTLSVNKKAGFFFYPKRNRMFYSPTSTFFSLNFLSLFYPLLCKNNDFFKVWDKYSKNPLLGTYGEPEETKDLFFRILKITYLSLFL